jgi:hypothetical protein
MGAFLNWLRERIRKDLEIIRARPKERAEPLTSAEVFRRAEMGNFGHGGARGPANNWGASPGPAFDPTSRDPFRGGY